MYTPSATIIPTRLLAPASAVALTLGIVGCSSQDTETTDHAAVSTISTATGDIDLPAGAWDAATSAAERCNQATPELIAGTIATVSGYDAEYTDGVGREGYAALAPAQWQTFGTDNPDERADLAASTDAVAAQLCDGFAVAENLANDGGSTDDAEQLALSVVLFGERYTREYGITAEDADADFDPHDQRAQISAIQDAAASVAT